MRRLFDPIKLAALGFALSLLAAWQLLADAHLISPIFFPSPMLRFRCCSIGSSTAHSGCRSRRPVCA